MSKYVLHYFNARGRGELARTILAAGNVEYTDHRINFPEWPELKQVAPIHQLPYLEIDNVVLPQSIAIARYLARELNLYGQNNLEQSQVDAVVDTVQDGKNAYYTAVSSAKEPDAKQQARNKFIAEDLVQKHYPNLEKLITLYGQNGNAVGNTLTIADLAIFDFAAYTPDLQAAAKAYPRLSEVVCKVATHPKIAAYLQTRPESAW